MAASPTDALAAIPKVSRALASPGSGAWSRFADRLAFAGLFLVAAGLIPGKAVSNLGLALLLLGFLLALPGAGRALLADGLTRLSLFWALWCLGLGFWAASRYPQNSPFDGVLETMVFVLVPAAAWATRGDPRRIGAVLLAAFAGLLLQLANEFDPRQALGFAYEFHALGTFRNAAVLFIDAGVLGGLALMVWCAASDWNRWHRGLGIGALFAATALLTLAWAAAPSRLSLVVLPLAAAMMFFLYWPRAVQQPAARRAILSLAAMLLVVLFASAGILAREWLSDRSTWHALAHGSPDAVAQDSTGLRVEMWRLALAHWSQHPLTGVGPRVAQLLAGAEGQPWLQKFPHFHNAYVEALLRTGLIGIAAYLAAAALILRQGLLAWRSGLMPPLLGAYLAACGLVFLVVNVGSSVVYFQRGWHFLVLLAGIAYGYRWRSPT